MRAAALLLLGGAAAQDPAHGWMAYAVGSIPSKYERITRLEMTWKVGAAPKASAAFFSPWFGMDPDDNLNLLQPVNPWLGDGWAMYTEYFQWSPEHNSNSKQYPLSGGNTLHGSIEYDSGTDSYLVKQTTVETGDVSSQTVKCQSGKRYTVPYVVYEKTFPCRDYPPDGVVTFRNITVECDGNPCDISWEAKVKDPNCDMTAHINKDGTISITWDTSLPSKYDNMTTAELYALNAKGGGWGERAARAMWKGPNAVVEEEQPALQAKQ